MSETQESNTDDEDIEVEAAAERTNATFVTRAPRRRATLDRLVEGPASPAGIAGDRAISASEAAEALDELFAHSMVEVLIDDGDRLIYGITPDGEQAIYRIQENRSV